MSKFDWKTVGGAITKYAPELGVAIAGPAGGAAGGLISIVGKLFGLGDNPTPDAVMTALQTDPAAAVKLAQIETEHKDKIVAAKAEIRVAELTAETEQIKAVNATMRAELASNNRFAADWRPMVGYVFAGAFGFVAVTVCILMYGAVFLGHTEVWAQLPAIIGTFTLLFGIPAGVLGVVAQHRGKADIQAVLNDSEDDDPAPPKK